MAIVLLEFKSIEKQCDMQTFFVVAFSCIYDLFVLNKFLFFISMFVDPSTDGKLNDSSDGEVTTTFSLPRLVNCSSKEYHLESFNDFLTLVPDYLGTIFVISTHQFSNKIAGR